MAHFLYGRPRSHLNYEETLALSQLQWAFPHGRQNAEAPIPGKPGYFSTRPEPRSSCNGKPGASRSSPSRRAPKGADQ